MHLRGHSSWQYKTPCLGVIVSDGTRTRLRGYTLTSLAISSVGSDQPSAMFETIVLDCSGEARGRANCFLAEQYKVTNNTAILPAS